MRVKVIQIVWHNKEPVFSLDFHPTGLLATCGADAEIKLWKITADRENIGVTFLTSITGDRYDTGYRTWNCVRFSPTGQSLAAAGDMGQVFIFKPAEAGNQPPEESASSPWKPSSCGGYSPEDVVDISWAADASGFVTSSNDRTCMFWDPEAKQGRAKLRLEGHKLYVQGVAWDPHHQFVVSQSADRSCRVFSIRAAVPGVKKKAQTASKQAINRLEGLYCSHVINKSSQPQGPTGQQALGGDAGEGRVGKKSSAQHLFHDEGLNSFFRRLSWSPDGSMLVVPAGVSKSGEPAGQMHVAYIFARGQWNAPLIQLPAAPKPVVASKFCPLLFQLEPTDSKAPAVPIDLPYRMVFAIATKDSVIVYNTQDVLPMAILGGLHLEQITDLAWSPDGLTLAISSYDSYCSVACFEEGELGTRMDPEQIPAHIQTVLWQTVAAEYRQKSGVGSDEPPRPKRAQQPATDTGKDSKARLHAATGLDSEPHPPAEAFKQPPLMLQPGANGGFRRVRRIVPVPAQGEPAGMVLEQVAEPSSQAPPACRKPDEEKQVAEGSVEHRTLTGLGMENLDDSAPKFGGLSIAELCAAAGKEAAVKVQRAQQ